jgi:hypothetical protein
VPHEPPQGDQKLARQGHDHARASAAGVLGIWFSTPEPDSELGRLCNSAPFDTLREAVLFVMRMSVDERESAMIRTHSGKELASQDIEAMDKKINQPST